MKKVYETEIINVGGRAGEVHSPNNDFSYKVTSPGTKKDHATNPEQLFAAAYSTCFNSALISVMKQEKVQGESTVDAHITLDNDPNTGYQLAARLDVEIKGVDQQETERLAKMAHQVCPYSKAIRNNVDVTLKVI
ncbi:organic hydroperoxide resistance protein [Melissococcus plutonius]|uniref:Organic hydroperoxide resistance protein n=1 Tax=Melissococcus plutonius TaxID=33970 RepID=A0A2Z5Y3X2_9ENTE|nr:organic hydroperoxide resistance protein [Melissococcus plutonius]BAL62575.1 organic hydroperoxide resistance protein [Melissococcus plutonius DAT561]MCV2498501.1 organic hydroperoxide resistance protein [Melissococcus plutonius]MCV2501060.1 organic hydroperoxide resistance protein [Melissococcus plutonius]MCV2504830.1 organic hydroperoxide resistance protein [Melissococcus plutonius]MCV2507291.1 organic hydroperoxide resistance protein [Melissococcus plutonius]